MTATETWFRQNCEALDVRALALIDTLPPTIGASALQLLSLIKGWCSSTRKDTVPACVVSDAGRRLRLGARQVDRMAAGLVACGLLARDDGGAYVLPDKNVIRQVTPAEEAKAPTSSDRRDRYRQDNAEEVKRRDRERKASRKASRNVADSTTASVAERRGTSRNDVAESVASVAESAEGVAKTSRNGDPLPSQTLPTPARKQAQTQAQNPPPPPAGGAEPERGGGQGSASEARGDASGGSQPDPKTSPTHAVEPDVAAEPVDPESQSAKVLARLKTYTRAYAEGISLATGKPSPPTMPLSDMRALGAAASCAVDGAGKLLRGEALLVWFREQARLYATVRADGAHFERGFAPIKFFEWLRAGASTTKVSPGQTPRARGQQINPQPADPGPLQLNWKPADPQQLAAEWEAARPQREAEAAEKKRLADEEKARREAEDAENRRLLAERAAAARKAAGL